MQHKSGWNNLSNCSLHFSEPWTDSSETPARDDVLLVSGVLLFDCRQGLPNPNGSMEQSGGGGDDEDGDVGGRKAWLHGLQLYKMQRSILVSLETILRFKQDPRGKRGSSKIILLC